MPEPQLCIQVPILLKTHSRGSKQTMMVQPHIAHTTTSVTHMSNTSSYSEIPQKEKNKKYKELPEPSEEDGLLLYQRIAVSLFLSLCPHLIGEGKPRGAKRVSTQTQETRLPIP